MVLKPYVSQHFFKHIDSKCKFIYFICKICQFCLQNYLVTFARGVFIASKVSNMLIDNKVFFGSFWQ